MLNQKPAAPSALMGAPLDAMKTAAMVLMVVDHINLVCFDESVPWMYYLGRASYPLFALVMACHIFRDTPLNRYLPRLVVFALISQPVFVLAFHEDVLNILFTLALGAIVAGWVAGKAPWRLHMVCCLAMTSIFFEEAIDFDLIGLILPALFVSVMRGERFALAWTGVILIFLNLDISDFVRLEGQELVAQELSWTPILTVAGTIVLPWVIYRLCRRISGDRFLPRYALYWFYPAHLLLLAVWRILAGNLSVELFSFWI